MSFVSYIKRKTAEEAAKSFEHSTHIGKSKDTSTQPAALIPEPTRPSSKAHGSKDNKASGPAEIVCDGPCHRILPKDKFLAKDVEIYLHPLSSVAIWCKTCQSLCVQTQCNGPCRKIKARAQYSESEWGWSRRGEAICKVCDGEEDPELNEDEYDFC